MESIDDRLARLFGDGCDFRREPSVLHVVAVCRDDRGGLCVLRTESADVPRSADDRFVLGVARARADAIVTTGANLRAEPRLLHHLHSDPRTAAELASWSKRDRPRVMILTASGDLPVEHRVFRESPSPIVVTGSVGAAQLSQRGLSAESIEIRARPSVRDAIELARERFGARTVSIEAGPRTAAQLYDAPAAVDELMLSLCTLHVPARAVGPQLFDIDRVRRLLGNAKADEADGWTFHQLFPNW